MRLLCSIGALVLMMSSTLHADIVDTIEDFELTSLNVFDSEPASELSCLDECCDNSCCGCCKPLPAPMMIGDYSGIPLGVFSGREVLLYQNSYSKVSNNNSAIPQDRVFFNYQYMKDMDTYRRFNGRSGGSDLSLYTFGMEKTLFCGRMSVDFLIPFSYSMDRDFRQQGNSYPGSSSQLEDIAFGAKGIIIDGECLTVSGGVRFEAPTGDDIHNVQPNRYWKNDAWAITPYLASLYSFSEDLFIQNFISYRLITDGNAAYQSTGHGQGGPSATFREPAIFGVDTQLGYWMMRNHGSRGVTGLMGSLELHYAGTFDGGYQPQGFNPPLLANFGGSNDILNLTAGLTALINDRSTVTAAFVAPVRNGPQATFTSGNPGNIGPYDSDRFFDWGFTVQFNYFFN